MGSKLSGDTLPNNPSGRPKKGTFVPKAVYAPCCKDWIWSTWSGHFQSCQCGESAVDQTGYYSRLIGVVAQRSIDKHLAKQLVSRKSGEQLDWVNQTGDSV